MAKDECDPFIVIGEIPAALTYQWVPVAILGDYALAKDNLARHERNGWGCVPWKRHPKMPRDRKWIVVRDQLLMQKPKRLVQETLRRNTDDARAMYDQHIASPSRFGLGDERRWSAFVAAVTTSDAWTQDQFDAAKTTLNETQSGIRYCEVTIGMVVSDLEIENASWLKLTPQEYIRRRVIMDTEVLMREPTTKTGEPALFSRAELSVKAIYGTEAES